MLRPASAFFLLTLGSPALVTAGPDYDLNRAQQFFETYCVRCHGEERSRSGVRVDLLTADFATHANASVWVEVRNTINLGEMPPFDEEPQPTAEEIAALSSWVAEGLRNAERSALGNEGRVLLRRMNRFEYANTLEDLLMVRFPAGETPLDKLPPDGTAEGFDKVSAALLTDRSLLRTYYEVARQVADKVIVDGEPPFPTKTIRFEFENVRDGRVAGSALNELGVEIVPGGLQLINSSVRPWDLIRYSRETGLTPTPTSGFYRFTVRATGAPGPDGEVPRLRLSQNHPEESKQTLLEFDLDAPVGQPKEYTATLSRDAAGGEVRIQVVDGPNLHMSNQPQEHFMRRNRDIGEAGQHAEVLRMAGRVFAEGWAGDRRTPDPEKVDLTQQPRAFLDYLEIEGPLYDSWPPRFQKEYLGEDSADLAERSAQMQRAREAFQRFLPRAFRRPVTADEVQPFVSIVESELAYGQTFHEAMRVGVAAVLTSPKFLFLSEPNPADEPRPLSDYEMASRLSYFLWSSMPDDTLFALAAQGQLTDPKVTQAQVNRMLADPKADRFVQGFARQWLRTDTFLAFNPDRHLFAAYDERLGEATVQEPLEFFRTVKQRNLSLFNFIDSDFVVVNDRLAEHYGIEGVEGEHFRPVKLAKDSPRGGLLGMAGVHLAGSDGLRTKPVTRAVYVREVLFNDPPDPPPPNAGEIEPNIRGEKLTVRDRLLQHQEIESCASCHTSLDPYGLALENFNVIGTWREIEDGQDFHRRSNNPPIVVEGRLPNGTVFTGFNEFRDALRAQENRFRRGLTEKVMTYALGRPVGPTDESDIERTITAMAQSNDTLSGLLHAVVASNAFRTK